MNANAQGKILNLIDNAERVQENPLYATVTTHQLRQALGLPTLVVREYRAVWPSGVVSQSCPVTTNEEHFFKAYKNLCEAISEMHPEEMPYVEVRELSARNADWVRWDRS